MFGEEIVSCHQQNIANFPALLKFASVELYNIIAQTIHNTPTLSPPLPSLNCFANFPCNFAQQKDNSLLYKRRNFQKVDAYSILFNTKRNNRLMLV